MLLRRLEFTSLLIFGVLIALALPCRVTAQEPSVYIVSVPMEEGLEAVATRAGAAARASLRGIEGVDWRTPDQRFLGYDDSALGVLERARQHLEAGRAAYLQLELNDAIAELQSAVESFDAASSALEDPGDLGQALLYLGASHAFNDQARAAIGIFRRLHIQMPFIRPDPDTFPPEVVALYTRARPRDARRPRGQIAIGSNPEGAIAYVDFLARGRTPLTVQRLLAGDHVVRVTRPGATPFVETVSVGRRAVESSAFLIDTPELEGLAEAIDEIAHADVSTAEEGPIATVGNMLQVDKIGVIRVSSAGEGEARLELLLFDVTTGRRLVRGEQTYGTAVGEFEQHVSSAVAAAFEAALRSTHQAGDEEAIPAVSHEPSQRVADDGPSTPILEEPWFWILIGALVLGGAAAAIAIPLATQGPPLGHDTGGQVVIRF